MTALSTHEERRVDAMLKMHELSMSRDPNEAAFGRVCKDLVPLFEQRFNAEVDRTQDIPLVIATFTDLLSTILLNMAINAAREGHEKVLVLDLLDAMKELIEARVTPELIKQARSHRQQL